MVYIRIAPPEFSAAFGTRIPSVIAGVFVKIFIAISHGDVSFSIKTVSYSFVTAAGIAVVMCFLCPFSLTYSVLILSAAKTYPLTAWNFSSPSEGGGDADIDAVCADGQRICIERTELHRVDGYAAAPCGWSAAVSCRGRSFAGAAAWLLSEPAAAFLS